MKKFLAYLLVVTQIICMLPVVTFVHAVEPDGTVENPYLISTVDDLKAIPTQGLDKHYKLMADIDLSGIATWTPIAATGTRFTGTFDGNGYTISNMKVTSVNGQCLGGLFGWIEYPAVVKNLTIENASVSIDHDFGFTSFGGLLVAYNMGGTIDNCQVTGALSVTNKQAKTVYLGGVVGISKTNGADQTATIVNCISDVDITLSCPAGGETYIGGIAAQVTAVDNAAYQAIVANCGYLGDITVNSALTANTYVGGIVGWMESANNASATKSQLHNCYSAGSITGLTHVAYAVNTGAIYGRLRYTSVSNVYALSDVATAHPGVDIQGAASVTGKTTDEMKSEAFVLALADAAEALNSGILASSEAKAMHWTPVEGGYPVQSAEKYVPGNVSDGTQEAPYLIYDADDLKAISTQGLDKHYKLMADIDLSGIANWTPIAATGTKFTGTFDGNGYTISNMKVTSVNGQCLGGLFGWIEYPAVVKNLTLGSASVSIDHDFGFTSFGGLLVAYNMGGTIDNCQVTGALSVANKQAKTVYLGGVVGISKTNGADKTATIVNCISDVDITLTCPAGGETYIGGIAAQVTAVDNASYKAIVANCGYLGDITVNSELTANTYVAGIVGWMESNNNASATKSELHNCYSAGSITGLTHAAYTVNTGAIYGRLRYTTVSNVYALTDVAAAHPGVDIQGAASVKGMTAEEMLSEAFVLALADAAEALNSGILASSAVKAMYWTPVEGGYPVQSAEKYVPVGGPDGSQDAPYLIYTEDDLKAISLKGLDKHYKLMADIDLSGIDNWTPIAATGTRFTGTFDGNGYTISNMKVTSVNGQCLGGLFGWIEYPAVVKNLTLDNASVSIDHDFGFTSFGGLLIAYNMGGTIDNCKVSGALSVTNKQAKEVSLGGIVGISKTNGADKTATIVNCISDVDITLTCPAGAATYIGGIVAKADAVDNASYKAIVANCGYLGDITVDSALTANTYVAGIVGWMESNNNASATKSQLQNCYSAGSITGLTHAAYTVNTGAIYGRLRYTTVSNVYALTDVAAAHPGVDIQGAASVKGMTAEEMLSEAFVLALADAAEALNSGILASSAVKAMYWTPVEGGYPVQSAEKYVPVGGPDGSQDAPYLIYTEDDLKAISLKGLDKHYKLMADIDLSGIANWTPIGATGTRFTGTFDGNGYTISNMKVTSVNGQCLGGLFGWIEYPAVVKNLTLDNASVSIDHDFAYTSFGGLLVAYNMGGTIDNCKVSGDLSVTNAQAKEVSLGGIVGISKTNGAAKTATIVNCISDVDITLTCPAGAATYIGGIAAKVDAADNAAYQAIVANCGYLGDITVDSALTANTYVAGIVGWMESNNNASATKSQLQNCYSAGSITGLTHAAYTVNTGAIYGRLRYTTVSNVYALSDVATAHPGVDIQGVASVTGKTTDQMQSEAFAQQLSVAAGNLNVALFDDGAVKLSAWTVDGGYPILTLVEASPEDRWINYASATLTGSGTEEDPYLISSAADLAYLAKNPNLTGYYVITEDIDLSESEWVPIKNFAGVLDGNNKLITGLRMGEEKAALDADVAGLFESTSNAILKNINVTVSIYLAPTSTAAINAAALVAKNVSSTIDNCVANGVIYVNANNKSGHAYVGGLTAQNYSSGADKIVKIMNCVNNANVTLNTKWAAANIKDSYVAGIAADVFVKDAETSAWILNCANKGTICTKIAKGTYTQSSYMGGIVGRFEDTNSDAAVRGELQNCYNYGQIKGIVHKLNGATRPKTQHYVGAVFGRNRYVNKASLYYLEGTCDNGGTNIKLEGDAIALPKAKLQSSAFLITMNNGAADANDLLGTSLLGWEAVSGQYPALTSEVAVATPENKWTDSGKYSPQLTGSGTAADPYLIKSAADMAYLAKKRNQSGYFKLMANIDLSAWEWVPIQGFTGTFEGNGYTIRGMWIGKPAKPADETTAGLFAAATKATIRNVKLRASIYVAPTTTNAIAVAGLVAKNNGSLIDNCSVSGVIHVRANAGSRGVRVGGITAAVSSSWDGTAYRAYNAKIVNCINHADIDVVTRWKTRETDYKYVVGGVIAEAYAGNKNCSVWVMNCANMGTIHASVAENTYHYQAYIGGVAGWMEATSNTSTPIEFHNCFNIGALTGNITYLVNDAGYVQYVGGIFGRVRNMNSSNLYALHGTYERPGREIFSNGLNEDSGEFKREETMKSAAFVAELSKKARELNQNMKVSALVWGTGEDGWPVLGYKIALGQIVTVSVNSERFGSAYLQEKVNGKWKNAFGAMFSKGVTIRVAFDFTSESCYIEKAFVNGNEISLTSEEYVEIQINEDTEVEIVFGLHPATKTVELFVKPGAAENGDGSQAQPFATLQQAADKIVTILEEDANTIIHVNLMDGKHVLQQTLVLNESHSPLAKVVFQNAEGANPIITSGQKIDSSKFKPVAGTDYFAYQFTDADKINGEYPEFRELQVNGKSATMAKSEMYMLTANVGMDGSFKIPVELLAGITNENLEGAQLIIASEWQVYGLHFGSIEPDTDKFAKLYIEASDWDEYIARVRTKRNFAGRNFFVQNHIALLDEPGEFYYDQSTGTIYYYPYADENLSDCTVEYAMLDRLIYMENAYNYVFDGLTFTGTSNTRFNQQAMLFGNGAYPIYYYDEGPEEIAGAICGTYTEDLTVQNCTFTELDTGGVMFEYGVKNFNIESNTFRELGLHAIALGSKQLVWNSNDTPGGVEDVLISNNYVDRIGLEVLCATGIRVAKAMNTKVLHNTVKNVPYSGIGMGMGFTLVQPNDNFINLYNVEIAYNHVENYMYNGNDGGAIYICGANATVDYKTTDRVSVHDNYIKANGYDKTAVGIYHDGSASNVHTYNNVIVDVASSSHGVIFTQWHIENQLAHNILIENNYSTIQAPTCGLGEEYNIVFKNNQVFEDSSKLPAEAQAIIQAAGVESDHAQVIKPVYLEMTKLDVSVHYDITRYGEDNNGLNTVAKFKLTNNDTAARKLQLVVEGLPEGVTYTVSGDGVLLQPGESAAVEVTFTADPETFAPSRAKSMLKLSVVEENGRKMSYPKAISMILKQMPEQDRPIESEGGDWLVVAAIIAFAVVVLGAATVVTVIAVKKKKK